MPTADLFLSPKGKLGSFFPSLLGESISTIDRDKSIAHMFWIFELQWAKSKSSLQREFSPTAYTNWTPCRWRLCRCTAQSDLWKRQESSQTKGVKETTVLVKIGRWPLIARWLGLQNHAWRLMVAPVDRDKNACVDAWSCPPPRILQFIACRAHSRAPPSWCSSSNPASICVQTSASTATYVDARLLVLLIIAIFSHNQMLWFVIMTVF